MTEEQKKEIERKKEYLRSYIPLVKRIRLLDEQIRELELSKIYPCVVNDGMPHGSSIGDLSSYMARKDELERELIKARYNRIVMQTDILTKIEQMEDETEKNLLTLKYIKGLKWEDVCVEMGYSWKQIHRYHASALSNFKMT